MKKITIALLILVASACSEDDPQKYPVPAGCKVYAMECQNGAISKHLNEDPDVECAQDGGFKQWVCQ